MWSPPHEKPKMTCFPNKIWLKWSRMARWWRKSLDVFFISIPLFDIQFFVIGFVSIFKSAKTTGVCNPCAFWEAYRFTTYEMSISRFPVATFSKNQSSFPAMRGLPTTMQRDMGKVGFFGFSLGNLEHFIFFGMLTLVDRIEFSVALAEIREYTPCLRTIYWLCWLLTERSDFGAILRFQSAHLSVKPSSSEGFFCDPTLWGVKTWRKLSHVSFCFYLRCWILENPLPGFVLVTFDPFNMEFITFVFVMFDLFISFLPRNSSPWSIAAIWRICSDFSKHRRSKPKILIPTTLPPTTMV